MFVRLMASFRSAILAATFRSRLHLSEANFRIRFDFHVFSMRSVGLVFSFVFGIGHDFNDIRGVVAGWLATTPLEPTVHHRLPSSWYIFLIMDAANLRYSADQQGSLASVILLFWTGLWPWASCHLQECQCELRWRTWSKRNVLSLQMFRKKLWQNLLFI